MMKTLTLALDIASIILSIITIAILLATWNKSPEVIEPEE